MNDMERIHNSLSWLVIAALISMGGIAVIATLLSLILTELQ